MNIEYIKRDVKLNYLTGSEMSTEIQWIVKYFKDLTHRYENRDGIGTWYDESGQR